MKNKKNIIIFIVILLIVSGGVTFWVTKRNDEEVQKETTAPKVNTVLESYKKQVEMLPEELKKDSKNVQLIHQYAVSLFATGKFTEAKEQYLKEIEINSNDPVVFNNLGNVYRELKQYEEAAKSYEKSIELLAKNNPAYVNLADMYLRRMGDENKAIEVYKRLLLVDPENKTAKEGLK